MLLVSRGFGLTGHPLSVYPLAKLLGVLVAGVAWRAETEPRMSPRMPRGLASCAIAACSLALAIGWLARRRSSPPPQPDGQLQAAATRHNFNDLRSGSLARPTSADSPDLEDWLTTTRDGLLQQRAALARLSVSPPTVTGHSLAAAACGGGCSRMWRRLQPHVAEVSVAETAAVRCRWSSTLRCCRAPPPRAGAVSCSSGTRRCRHSAL